MSEPFALANPTSEPDTRQSHRKAVLMIEKQCKHCNVWFVAGMFGDRQKYCSKRCNLDAKTARQRASKASVMVTKSCRFCGAAFETDRSAHYYCSPKCRQDHNNSPKGCHGNGLWHCVICGADTTNVRAKGKRRGGKLRACSAECKAIYETDRRRIDRSGAGLQDIADLYLAQEYRCAGCDWLMPIHALSIDHITPKSKGGSMVSRSNHQLLCLTCNTLKREHSMDHLAEMVDQCGLRMRPLPVDEWLHLSAAMRRSLDDWKDRYRLPHVGRTRPARGQREFEW